MSAELDYLSRQVALGHSSRREFLGRAAALGMSTAVATTLLSTAARAAGPIKGGIMKVGTSGGAATDSLDPARAASQMPYMTNYTWGELLVRVKPSGELEP